MYRDWPGAAPPLVEVVAITPPGRLHRIREPAMPDFSSYIEALASEIACCADRPFAFFGHSLGSLIAFEVGRRLASVGAPVPARLFASACIAPGRQEGARARSLAGKSDDELVADLSGRYGLVAPALSAHPELRALAMSAFRDDLHILQTYQYRPGPPVDYPITALAGRHDPVVSIDDVGAWRAETTGDFELLPFPGQHMFVNSAAFAVMSAVWSRMQGIAGR